MSDSKHGQYHIPLPDEIAQQCEAIQQGLLSGKPWDDREKRARRRAVPWLKRGQMANDVLTGPEPAHLQPHYIRWEDLGQP